jgi:MFS family permease
MIAHFAIVKHQEDTAFYLGLMGTAFFTGRSVSQPFWGWFSDHLGRRKPILLTGIAGAIITFLLFRLSETYAMVTLQHY